MWYSFQESLSGNSAFMTAFVTLLLDLNGGQWQRAFDLSSLLDIQTMGITATSHLPVNATTAKAILKIKGIEALYIQKFEKSVLFL